MIGAASDNSVRSLLDEGASLLATASGSARLDAEILLAHASGSTRSGLLLDPSAVTSRESVALYRSFVERRSKHEPVAYIIGIKEFYKEVFVVSRDTLIPRPETEIIVECVVNGFGDDVSLSLIDVGTGSGCIALSIALERPSWKVTGVDVSSGALAVAGENCRRLDVPNISFYASDMFDAVTGKFDIVVSNPPYIDKDQYESLPEDVRSYEPHGALFAENEGVGAILRLLEEAPARMRPGGKLFCEIGAGQSERIEKILSEKFPAWRLDRFVRDYAGHSRLFAATLGG